MTKCNESRETLMAVANALAKDYRNARARRFALLGLASNTAEKSPAAETRLADILNPRRAGIPAAAQSFDWVALAKIVIEQRISPRGFVRDCFARHGDIRRPPQPADLRAALDNPSELLAVRAVRIHRERIAFAAQLDASETAAECIRRARGCSEREALAEALTGPEWPMTVMFRHCMLARLQHPGAARLRAMAQAQFETDPEIYDVVWAPLIPGQRYSASWRLTRAAGVQPPPSSTVAMEPVASPGARALGGNTFRDLIGRLLAEQPGIATTGVQFIDELLAGGICPGEVIGLLGPYGSCKTTLTAQLGVEAARRFYAGIAHRRRLAFIVSFEADASEMQRRAICYAARQPLDRVAPQVAPLALSSLRETLHIIDARAARQRRSTPPWEFITGRIEAICQAKKAECGFVAIDYVGALAAMTAMATGERADEVALARIINASPERARTDIASRHECPVWLVHQYTGNANDRAPWERVGHEDANLGSRFGENLDHVIAFARPTPNNRVVVRCTRSTRRAPIQSTVVQIEGRYGRVCYPEFKMTP